jgi:hypothetical protein
MSDASDGKGLVKKGTYLESVYHEERWDKDVVEWAGKERELSGQVAVYTARPPDWKLGLKTGALGVFAGICAFTWFSSASFISTIALMLMVLCSPLLLFYATKYRSNVVSDGLCTAILAVAAGLFASLQVAYWTQLPLLAWLCFTTIPAGVFVAGISVSHSDRFKMLPASKALGSGYELCQRCQSFHPSDEKYCNYGNMYFCHICFETHASEPGCECTTCKKRHRMVFCDKCNFKHGADGCCRCKKCRSFHAGTCEQKIGNQCSKTATQEESEGITFLEAGDTENSVKLLDKRSNSK